MYAIPAAFRFIKNIIWNSGLSEDSVETDCEEILNNLIEKEKNALPLGFISPDNYSRGFGKVNQIGLIGGFINRNYFNLQIQKPIDLKEGDVVEYLYDRNENGRVNIVKILSVVEDFDGMLPVDHKKLTKRVIVMKVAQRQGRDVIGSESGIKFNLDNVKIDFVPIVGDWLELCVLMEDTPDMDSYDKMLEVSEVKALRSLEVKTSSITHWDESAGIGTIGNTIFFTSNASSSFTPRIGDQVVVDAIESDQGSLTWRALSVVFISRKEHLKKPQSIDDDYDRKDISVEGNFNFGKMKIGESKILEVTVTNNTNRNYSLNRTAFCSWTNQSQIKILQGPSGHREISPKQSISFTFQCSPSLLGYSEEMFKFHFKNFFIKRVFKVYVENELCVNAKVGVTSFKNNLYKLNMKKHNNAAEQNVIKGVRMVRPPAFIYHRIPSNSIPKPIWTIMADYYESESAMRSNLVEDNIPIITTELDFISYREKFHTLLYLEEIAHIVSLRSYDMEKAYLLPEGDYLTLEVKGLSEGRPSLIVGDSIKARNPHDNKAPIYEGCIHEIISDKVFAKFSPTFHNSYRGEDLSIFFSVSRSNIIHSHYGIDLAVKHLGPELLFPERVIPKIPLLEIANSDNCQEQSKKKIKWFNDQLNEVQKAGIINALVNVARPLPYVIFGPPGTGKTVTLVETILQIWKLMPESRLLVVTPSNSAADLITERLIDSADITPGILVRIVAYHVLVADSMSDKLRPYCASVNISEKEEMQLTLGSAVRYFSRSNIGRHRITVATCSGTGRLINLGFPKGHFTHIIMDEAGQASEPETMIPLAFCDRNSTQIILAGDPKQLGPVLLSNHAIAYGLGESYLGRLIKTFPYQRDTESFRGKCDGYNPTVITKLLYNYRTIPKLLALPSALFYNSSLIPKVNTQIDWVKRMIDMVAPEVVMAQNNEHPGIMFYGVRGINLKSEDSPSWYNPHEASMLTLFLSKLFQAGVSVDDIGIVSPYLQQNKFIRTTLTDLELPVPKVGTVEEFQGQERRIIIASTVRSCEADFVTRVKNVSAVQIMGFLRNPKRLNVLLTRAQILLVIFGNPHTLVVQDDWKRVIEYCTLHGSYTGCDLPLSIQVKQDKKKLTSDY